MVKEAKSTTSGRCFRIQTEFKLAYIAADHSQYSPIESLFARILIDEGKYPRLIRGVIVFPVFKQHS
jgi:hypothetical protein